LENNGNGLYLSDTTNSLISSNNLKNNKDGITLFRCSNNTIFGNSISSNDNYGIACENSPNNEISKNQIMLNGKGGINLDDSVNSTIIENKISENGGNGIFLTDVKDSNIINNEIKFNTGCGIGFGYGPKGNVKENTVSNNDIGIWMSNAFENSITFNNVTQNRGWAVYLEGSQKNNTINHNNFIDNYKEEGCQVFIKGFWVYPGLSYKGSPSEAPPPELVAGAGNFWDNGVEGNYWSDHAGVDVDADGIGDTEYWINENNADKFPLALPITKQSNQPTPTTAPYPTLKPTIELEPLPTLIIIGPITSLAIAGVGLLIYFKKHKN
jgi:parallel beta-helix repeat protein